MSFVLLDFGTKTGLKIGHKFITCHCFYCLGGKFAAKASNQRPKSLITCIQISDSANNLPIVRASLAQFTRNYNSEWPYNHHCIKIKKK